MLVASIISAAMPYLAYRIALHFGMPPSLENLSVKILFVLTVLYALLNSAAHSVWYRLRNVSSDSLNTFFVMFIGDLIGTLVIIYSLKFMLVIFDQLRKKE
jgi:ABC-type Co2+ transport system permease subunit